jgi:hypothetical protein
MDIRELLKGVFNEDLPISGGMGNSIEAAVVLESAGPLNDYLSLEYQVMDLISRGRNVSWEFKGQELVVKDDKKYDKLLVAVKGIHGNPMPLHLENHYFDITKCNNMLGEVDKDEEKMRKMKSFLDEMLRLTES